MKSFMQKNHKDILGAIAGWDRLRFRGTIRWLANTSGINSYIIQQGILIKHFSKWAESITRKVRSMCEAQAKSLDIPVIYLRSSSVDKEKYARRIMQENGIETGDICMFSIVEPCIAPRIKGNKSAKKVERCMRFASPCKSL